MSLLKDVIGYGLHADRPAASSEGRLYYETDTDTLFRDSGSAWDTLSLGSGAGGAILSASNTFTAGPNIFEPATAADVPLVVKGFSGQSADLQQWKDASGTVLANVRASGLAYYPDVVTEHIFPNGSISSWIDLSSSAIVFQSNSASTVTTIIKGYASQTADLQEWRDSADHTQLGVANAGSGASPSWALRIRALANAESMGQSHTLGAYTGRSIQVVDDAGSTVGWLPLYA